MAKLKLRGKDLVALGYEQHETRSLAMQLVGKAFKHQGSTKQLEILAQIIAQPHHFEFDPIFSPLALRLLEQAAVAKPQYDFQDKNFEVFGREHIDHSALEQMRQAMSLPISRAGALMPDAHHGYGLPIGGVLATENALIPYGVGMDIGCRMALSIFGESAQVLDKHQDSWLKLLTEHTRFGTATFEDNKRQDPLLDDPRFAEQNLLRQLQNKAYEQIGSSGSGNHFVEFGQVQLEANNPLGLESGLYLGLLSHSGSRGLGAKIAGHFTELARKMRNLPKELGHLSWLYWDEAEGQAYWQAMQLAGDYASANHRHIHQRISKALKLPTLARIENHHNFAWQETIQGQNYFVHRKGATPASLGTLGIIPGSMTAPAYLVVGKGQASALDSASHGAGRLFSRRKAQESFNKKQVREHLQKHQVQVIGGGLDEAPFAYKDIQAIMQAQSELVHSFGKFQPRFVRMDNGNRSED